jgi:BlaI family penicillinase repressor
MTKSKEIKSRIRAPLTDLENEIMGAVWSAGPSSVESVHRVVSRKRKLKEVSIRTLLRRLEMKGYLRHNVEGRAFIYSAVEPARSLAGRAVRQIIDRLCQGSVEELVSGMVDADLLSKDELNRLTEFVRKRREEGK